MDSKLRKWCVWLVLPFFCLGGLVLWSENPTVINDGLAWLNREKKWLFSGNGLSLVLIIIGFFVWLFGFKKTSAKQHITYNGITFAQYKQELSEQEQRIRTELEAASVHEKELLALELKAVENKLLNVQESYQEALESVKQAEGALLALKSNLPSAQLKQALADLQNKGDTTAAEQAFDQITESDSADSIALAAYHSGLLAEQRVDYRKAIKQLTKAVALDDENTDYLSAAGNMARTIAEYSQAQLWLQKALDLREQQPQAPLAIGDAQHNLADVFRAQGEYAKALPLYQRSLALNEKALGEDHPSVAATLNNLAGLYRAQGEYAKALPLYQRSLAISEKALGEDHPSVAATLNNLAGLYRAQGEYAKALPLYQRSLALKEKALGEDHPSVAVTLNNLAGLYQSQGEYAKALPLYQRVLAILNAAFPNGHPNIDTVQANYADLLQQMKP